MPGPKGVVENHPKRKEILERILAGQTSYFIAKAVSPPISVDCVKRFRTRELKCAKAVLQKPHVLRAIAAGMRIPVEAPGNEDTSSKGEVAQILRRQLAGGRGERMEALSEKQRDPKNWAATVQAECAQLRLLGELTGELDSGKGQQNVNIGIAFSVPLLPVG